MEVELFSNAVSEEDIVEVDADNDNFGDVERCGICMDVVVDRGVLDCCQHWFCFVCIDNWASITNLCPLCQNEFQLITCVPVYDTIGGDKTDSDLDLRDNVWCVEGKNNTLSFPSYYIDENAVACLDGDGCKLRSGSLNYEETLTLDTSIACDSCDLWYHAFCVGFDPEGAEVDSWLCPRCSCGEPQLSSDFKGACITYNQLDPESADHGCLVDTSSGKVSISVADDGETAVVVSRIGGEHFVEESIAKGIQTQEFTNSCNIEMPMSPTESCSPESNNLQDQVINVTQPRATTRARFDGSFVKSEPEESSPGICLDPVSFLTAKSSEDEKTENLLDDSKCPPATLGKSTFTDETVDDVKADLAPKVGVKRKCTDYSFLTNDEDGYDEVRHVNGSCRSKVKSHQGASLNDATHIGASDDDQKSNVLVENSVDEIGKNVPSRKASSVDIVSTMHIGASDDNQKPNVLVENFVDEIERNVPSRKASSVDIMSIVQDREPRRAKKLIRQKAVDNCAKIQKNATGLRVKKIMRRPSEDQKSADVVQKLRKEIREAVLKKPSNDAMKSVVDPNLLAAFRAAVTGSAATPVKKASARAKKLILHKGKTRENLAKKIYSTSNGKRRRAWDRDCEVEFWKHRCLTTAKPEKIETLRSVLNLLKRSPETEKVEEDSEDDAKAPILSRLYLADASVFPRNDDIKPLSVLKAAAGSKQNEEPLLGRLDTRASQDHGNVGCPDKNEVQTQDTIATADGKNFDNVCNRKNEVVSAKTHSGKKSGKSSSQKMMACKADVKVDKRKWALAVLARKTASNSTSPMHQKQDNAELRGNYPLLAELPTDMRPKLASIRHNKIPVSIRQAQLYRLTERFLRMANLSSIHRTAATELAVADAINIEKQVADRSSSKAVYLNLCSQEIRHRTNCNSADIPVESKPSSPLPVASEGGESSMPSLDSEVEMALRAAGLLADSPPCSPNRNTEDVHDNEDLDGEADEEEMKDIFEMVSQPDLDIYGDFEYDLDEEFYTDLSASKASNSLAAEGESKVKVVFSTLGSNEMDKSLEDDKDGDLLEAEEVGNTSNMLGSAAVDHEADSLSIPREASLDGEKELSVTECEELYVPDKEPPVNNFSAVPSAENVAPQGNNTKEIKNLEENNLVSASCQDIAVDGKSSSIPHAGENTEDTKNDPEVDKSGHVDSVQKKVEAYIKEHIRPLCKSRVITVEQYRWAVGKTTDKVMKYHSKAKNANFLIKEGEKVKKLAEQYVETAKHKENK